MEYFATCFYTIKHPRIERLKSVNSRVIKWSSNPRNVVAVSKGHVNPVFLAALFMSQDMELPVSADKQMDKKCNIDKYILINI